MSWRRQPFSTLVTAAGHEPIDLAEAKLYLRVDHDYEDVLIESLITAARVWVEIYTRRALCHETWDLRYQDFPQPWQPLIVPRAPLSSVTSITYLDVDGASQTWESSNYAVRTLAGPTAGRGWIETTSVTDYPALSSEAAYPVTVRIVAGYSHTGAQVPQGLKAAIYLLLGDLYASRQETITGTISSKAQTTVERLIGPYRLPEAA